MSEEQVIAALSDTGPLTGAALVEKTGIEVLPLWQMCRKCSGIRMEIVGRRYLRLDRNVEGYARLSPSIRREFLTYTFIGLEDQIEDLGRKTESFRRATDGISLEKRDVAGQSIVSTLEIMGGKEEILEKSCFILAGDVVYGMAHTVSRPEQSTGEMVRGSDLDIIVVTEDDLDPVLSKSLDDYMHKRKHLLLVNEREEIDYLIKTVSRVREQLKFDIFSSMVASKILYEGEFLYANRALYGKVKELIAENRIAEKLAVMEQEAIRNRELAEAQLLGIDPEKDSSEYMNLFFTQAEEDEIY